MTAVAGGQARERRRPGGSRSAPRRPAAGAVVAVIGPSVLAALLCGIALTGRSLGFDEGATVAIASQSGAALWRGIAHDGGNMSGYYLLIHVLIGWFGEGPWVLRVPSAVFAALTPGAVAGIALALGLPRRTAALAGVLAAVSLPLVSWGQTTRGYAGMLLFACVGTLCFVRWVRGGGRGWAIAYVLATALAAYGGFIVILIVLPQGLALLGRDRGLRLLVRFAGLVAGVIVLCLPIAVLAARRGSGQLFWVGRPTRQTETYVMQTLTSSGLQSTFHRVFTTTPGWIGTSVVLLGLIGLCARAILRRLAVGSASRGAAGVDPLGAFGMRLALLWALVPGLLELLGSWVGQPVFLPRNVLVSVPAVALVLAIALTDRRLPRWLAVSGIGLALLVRVVPVAAGYGKTPEPWKQVTARVLGAARPGDCVVFYPEDGRNAFRYYVTQDHAASRAPRAVLPAVPWSDTRPFVELYPTLSPARVTGLRAAPAAGGCRRVWLVSSHEGQPNGPALSRRHLARFTMLERRLTVRFGPRLGHFSDGWASAIHVSLYGRG